MTSFIILYYIIMYLNKKVNGQKYNLSSWLSISTPSCIIFFTWKEKFGLIIFKHCKVMTYYLITYALCIFLYLRQP